MSLVPSVPELILLAVLMVIIVALMNMGRISERLARCGASDPEKQTANPDGADKKEQSHS